MFKIIEDIFKLIEEYPCLIPEKTGIVGKIWDGPIDRSGHWTRIKYRYNNNEYIFKFNLNSPEIEMIGGKVPLNSNIANQVKGFINLNKIMLTKYMTQEISFPELKNNIIKYNNKKLSKSEISKMKNKGT